MTDPTWDTMAAELASDIQRLHDGDIIILEVGPRYVQLMQGPRGGSLEASSNHSLPQDAQLSAAKEQALESLGWQPPHRPGRNNWWSDYDWPLLSTEAARLANRLVDTLRNVMDVHDTHKVIKRAFNAYD